MTRGELVARCAAEIGLDSTPGGEERTFLDGWANEAVTDVLLETKCRVELGDLSLLVGVKDYRLDAGVMQVYEIDPSGSDRDVEIIDPDDLYQLRRTETADDVVSKIAVTGDLLQVWPTPTTSQTLRYIYVARPTSMTDDDHDPADPTYGGVPKEFHQYLLDYMNYRASRYDGTRAPLNPRDYLQLYNDGLKTIRKRTRGKTKRGLLPARIGYPGRGVARRNDVYPAR